MPRQKEQFDIKQILEILITYWSRKKNYYTETNSGIFNNQYRPGGTYTEINIRRAESKIDFYRSLLERLNNSLDIKEEFKKQAISDYKRNVRPNLI